MSTVSVRISQEEKRQLQKYGKLSDTLRQAMKLYLNKKKTEELSQVIQKIGEAMYKAKQAEQPQSPQQPEQGDKPSEEQPKAEEGEYKEK